MSYTILDSLMPGFSLNIPGISITLKSDPLMPWFFNALIHWCHTILTSVSLMPLFSDALILWCHTILTSVSDALILWCYIPSLDLYLWCLYSQMPGFSVIYHLLISICDALIFWCFDSLMPYTFLRSVSMMPYHTFGCLNFWLPDKIWLNCL